MGNTSTKPHLRTRRHCIRLQSPRLQDALLGGTQSLGALSAIFSSSKVTLMDDVRREAVAGVVLHALRIVGART